MTQLEVAKEMGISRSRVYQIEQVALAKLKKRLSAIGIKREDVISRKYQGKSA
ncbi:MAG: sigma factor-like helix-turn-helix DNA-binding protein [Candidatus Heimdallarchaeaceae archaeon]